MHGSIRDRLEDLLGAGRKTVGDEQLAHLAACPDCSLEVNKMEAQSEMLRLLRAPEQVEPTVGFYSRVMQKVEEQRAKGSIWTALATSPFGTRLVYASLTLAVVLGSYVIVQDDQDGIPGGHGMVAQTAVHVDAQVFGDLSQQRDAVLTNFASH